VTACRSILTVLEAKPGQPLAAAPQPSDVTGVPDREPALAARLPLQARHDVARATARSREAGHWIDVAPDTNPNDLRPTVPPDPDPAGAAAWWWLVNMSGRGPPPKLPLADPKVPMPNVASTHPGGSSDPPTTRLAPEGSALPLGMGRSPSAVGILPPPDVNARTTIRAQSTPNETPRSLQERDYELIDFLVRKSIETCMPSRPTPLPSTRAVPKRRSRRKA
jgi:hypothetical protein